ncbi:MAG: IclR family transcriptional regulator [Gaiellales bacterium]
MNPGNAALGRGLDALVALGSPEATRDGLGVSRLAELLGVDKSQASRTLAVLDDRGFATRDPETLAYRLGRQVFALAALTGDAPLVAAARPELLALVAALGESAHLSVRHGDEVLTLASESPAAAIHAPGRVGGLTPLATTSAGRVLATTLSDDELAAAGLADVADRIAEARAQGHAIVRDEFEAGLVSVAAPIRDAAGRVVAALNVSAPAFRFDDRVAAAAPMVEQAADRVAAAVGGPVPA